MSPCGSAAWGRLVVVVEPGDQLLDAAVREGAGVDLVLWVGETRKHLFGVALGFVVGHPFPEATLRRPDRVDVVVDLEQLDVDDTVGTWVRIEEVIGGRLKAAREAAGLSLKEVGAAVGEYLEKPWTAQAVWQAEQGQRDFKIAHLLALALVLDVPVVALLAPQPGRRGAVEIDNHTLTDAESARLFVGVATPWARTTYMKADARLTELAQELRDAANRQLAVVKGLDEVSSAINGLMDEEDDRSSRTKRRRTARRAEEDS